MAQLSTKIKKYLEANSINSVDFLSDVLLEDNGSGPYIKEWNIESVVKPTDEQLATYESTADDEEYNNSQIVKRIAEYGSWKDQLDEIYTDIEAWKTRIAGIKTKYPKR
jgi:hypothetical protein